jgi:phage N-6-adenine-methyltransferase
VTRGSRPKSQEEVQKLMTKVGPVPAVLVSNRVMPAQKPGRSIQNYGTPPEFILAVKRRFRIKDFEYDLAAEAENTKAEYFYDEEEDSLKQHWETLVGPLWLNPPFGHIEPWAEKCKISTRTRGRAIYFLTPASVGASWFARHVWRDCNHAGVLALEGRLSFDGKAPYPKDCCLTVFRAGLSLKQFGFDHERFDVWDWREELNR